MEALRRFHARFVGRSSELRQLLDGLEGPGPRVVHVRGIGGIGKSALLQALSEHVAVAAWHDALSLPDLDTLIDASTRGVLVLDGLDQAPGVTETLRQRLLPQLGADARLVLASRNAPSVRWSTDLGPERFTAVRIDGLGAEEARELFEEWGGEASPELLELCNGHPLMLVLAAQLALPEKLALDELERAPDLVVAMVEALGAVPTDPMLRRAVTVCAIARRTTEPLLRAVLEIEDASALFDRLAASGWALRDDEGLFPHDLVRSAQRADAKWRDRPTYDRHFRAVADFALARARREGSSALADVLFLLADNAFYRGIAAHRHGVQPGPPVPVDDPELIRSFYTPHYGPAHAQRILDWMDAGRLTVFALLDGHGEPSELMPVLDGAVLTEPPTGDPLVDCAQRLYARLDARPGSRVIIGYGACHRAAGLASPLGNTRILVAALRMALALDSLVAMASVVQPVELWRPMLERNPLTTLFEEVDADGLPMLVQFQDLRVLDVVGWLETQLYPPPFERPIDVELLDADEFALAVREGLRALASKDAAELGGCRLARTPLVLRASMQHQVAGDEALRSVLTEAITTVVDERCRRVLERTYLDPAPKQYAAAVELGLSFATYRRALGRGVELLTAALWEQETQAS